MLNKQQKIYTLFIVLVLWLLSMNLEAVPNTINFQGALKDANGEPVNDTQFMEFLIYDVPENGTPIWVEQHPSVTIENGIFNVQLGEAEPFPDSLFHIEPLYITFLFGGEEMMPRQQLISVPYARMTEHANSADTAQYAVYAGATAIDSLYINSTGPDTMTANSSLPVLSLSNTGSGDAIHIASTGDDGVYLNNVNTDGIHIKNAGDNGVHIEQSQNFGVRIDSTGNDGIYVRKVGSPSNINSAVAKNGLEVAGAQGNGLYVGHADLDGLYVNSAGDDGVHIHQAGNPSSFNSSVGKNGIEIEGAEYNGLYIGYSGDDGIYIDSTDTDGLEIDAAYYHGIRVSAANLSGAALNGDAYGVHATTTNANGEYGVYTADKMFAASGFYPTKNGTFAKNTGSNSLEPGDVVSIAGGYEVNVLGEKGVPVVNIEKANSRNSEAVFGVVEYKVKIEEIVDKGKTNETITHKSFRFAAGDALPGDYLAIIVFGPADVNLNSRSQIEVGQRLTISAQDGKARNINDNDDWRVGIIGKALENSNGSDKLKVFVNCK